MAHIALIIVNFNGKKDTIECLNSLTQCQGIPYTPIVIDNGSSDGSVSSLRAHFPNLTLLESEKNLGFSGGNNLGITYALARDFTHICLLNNDTTVHPNFLQALLSFPDTNALIGAKLLNAKNPSLLDHLGGKWNPHRLDFDLIGLGMPASDFTTPLLLDYICGCTLFAKREIFEKVGLLYEPYFLYWEESDYCYRAQRLGIPSYFTPDAIVYHKGAITHEKKSPVTSYYAQRNRLLFLSRNIVLTKLHKKLLRKTLFRKWKHFILHLLQYPFSRRKKRIQLEWAEIQGIMHATIGRFGKL